MSVLLNENGSFSGYASIFGKIDQGGDVVMPGAFQKSLLKRGANQIRMLFQHDPKEPIGFWRDIRETDIGLRVIGQLTPGVQRSAELARLIQNSAIDGLSIGFRTVRASSRTHSAARKLFEVDLWEISIVAFPMLDVARIANPNIASSLKAATKTLSTTC
jgi:HK97 family phage prohead protease